MKNIIKGGVLSLCLFFAFTAFGGEYDFDMSEIEKKPYSFGGYVEIVSNLYDYDTDSAMYGLKYRSTPSDSDYSAKIRLDGSYEIGGLKYTVKTLSEYADDTDDSPESNFKFLENFISYSEGSTFRLDAGKKAMKWGKGYAYNPAAFLDRPKNIDSPDDALEGYTLLTADYTASFGGALKTLTFSPAAYTAGDEYNRSLGSQDGLNFAGKIYALIYDTDIDVMFSGGESRGRRFGADFSRNITTNFELHGEYGHYNDAVRQTVTGSTVADSDNWLVGFRYLTESELTYIVEYFHKSAGYTEEEMETFYDAAETTLFSDRLLNLPYAKNNPMQNYLYLRASFKEPADILYLTPAVTVVANADDGSFSLSPEVVYTGVINHEFRLKAMFLNGGTDSEYGEKPTDMRVEARVRFYF